MKGNPGLGEFFASGFYEAYWPEAMDEASAEKLAPKILSLLGAETGHILDWQGGAGRFAIWFARAGLKVTLLDITRRYLERARELFRENGLPVDLVEADSRQTPPGIQADYAVCLENSVGMMTEEEDIEAFCSLHAALKPGAKLLVDCMNLFFLARPIAEGLQEPQRGDGIVRNTWGEFDLRTSTWHKTFEIIGPDGSVERKTFNQVMFTPRHLSAMLAEAGFTTEGIYGDFDGNPVSFDSVKIVLVARRRD